jgi:hypothetical protein
VSISFNAVINIPHNSISNSNVNGYKASFALCEGIAIINKTVVYSGAMTLTEKVYTHLDIKLAKAINLI